MRIIIVTDGGLQLGMGHVQQSIALAGELASGAEIEFYTRSSDAVLAKIRANGFRATRFHDDGGIFEALKAADPDIVIFDKLDVAPDLARDIKERLRARLAIFTNLTEANQFADMAVTADIGSRFENVRYVDQKTGTLTYYGPRYWILRRDFYAYAARKKEPRGTVERVLLMFGGSDPANITSEALAQMLRATRPLSLDVVLGAQFGYAQELEKVMETYPARANAVRIHRNVDNIAELMFAADLVLASPGLSAFEALCVGTPVIVIPQNELQRDTYEGFMRMLERDQLGRLDEMIARSEFTFPNDPQIARMEIGLGVSELRTEIFRLARESHQ